MSLQIKRQLIVNEIIATIKAGMKKKKQNFLNPEFRESFINEISYNKGCARRTASEYIKIAEDRIKRELADEC